MAIKIDGITSIVHIDTNGVSSTYFEQSIAPLEAKAGDTWRDTDTNIIALLTIDNGIRIWMEI